VSRGDSVENYVVIHGHEKKDKGCFQLDSSSVRNLSWIRAAAKKRKPPKMKETSPNDTRTPENAAMKSGILRL
jgi:hypothetical protein